MLGVKTTNLPALAAMRVRRGVDWCDRRVPEGWQRHLLDVNQQGKLAFRGRLLFTSGHDSLLGLIYEDHPEFVLKGSGYVSDVTVMRRFGLTIEKAILLGFYADYDGKGIPHARETAIQLALEDAWLTALTTYARPPHVPRRHDVFIRAGIAHAAAEAARGTIMGHHPFRSPAFVRADNRN